MVVAGYCLEKAKRVLSFHASTLWRATTSDEFEFVCGKIWLISDDISQRLRPLLLSEVLTELSISDESSDDALNKETFGDPSDDLDDGLIAGTSFQNLSNTRRLVLSQRGHLEATETEKVIRRPLLISSKTCCPRMTHLNHTRTPTVMYSNPFDSRLFCGFSPMLKCHLIGSPSPFCEQNLFMDRENSIQLMENFLLGYSLFIMVPALTYMQSPCHSTDVCWDGDQNYFKFLNSWKLLLDVMSIPQQLVDKLAACQIEHIWSWDDSRFSPGKSVPKKNGEQSRKVTHLKEPDGSGSQLSKLSQDTRLSAGCQTSARCLCCNEKRCLKGLQESETHSPYRKLKKLIGDMEIPDGGSYAVQQLQGAGDSNLCRLRCAVSSAVKDETTNGDRTASMNPLAEPFILNTTLSCEEQIMADQYLLNHSFGTDEPIEDRFCPTFFPLMPLPPFAAQIGKITSEQLNFRGEPNNGTFKSCQPSTAPLPESTSCPTSHAPVTRQNQQMCVTPTAASTKPGISQQTSMLLNATVPSRCAWVPTRPLLLRPIHPVNQAGMMPAQTLISNNMTAQPPQMLIQGHSQLPLYLMQSHAARPLPSLTNQQFSQVCRPMQLPTTFVPVVSCQQNLSRVSSSSIANTQAQKDLIKSALEMMKSRPTASGSVQLTPSH